MVLDNELAGNIIRLRKGIVVNEDTLAFEGIIKAMDGTRNFLGQKHTMKHLRTELNLTKLAERTTWETWEKNERKGIAERAADEAERILREHQVLPLEDQQEKALDEIMAAAAKEVVKKR
jgi:trimethylamine--corrinoid protein Co-methyltransferase